MGRCQEDLRLCRENNQRLKDERDMWKNLAQSSSVVVTPPPPTNTSRKGISLGGAFQTWSATDRGRELDLLKAAGCAWVRLDFNYDYPSISHTVAAEARSRGMKVLGNPMKFGAPKPSVAQYAAFCKAEAMSGQADAFEIWNEPNLSSFWLGTPDPVLYTQYLNAAYDAIKSVSNIPVISGGLSPSPDQIPFAQAILDNGGKFDYFGWHPYSTPALPGYNPQNAWSAWHKAEIFRPKLLGKGFWFTEYGAPTAGINDPGIVTETGQPNSQDAQITTAFQVLNPNDGPLFIYTGRDLPVSMYPVGSREPFYGLLRLDWSPKPAYYAFKKAVA